MDLKLKALLSGLSTYLPGYDRQGSTGGTDSARYCYSVWLRHLVLAAATTGKCEVPRVVAELGPGDSLGIGLASLLSGAERYFALDLVKYSNPRRNLEIFDELRVMFAARSTIPDEREFPNLHPKLESYAFPSHLLSERALELALEPTRVATIRSSVESGDNNSMISYKAPWSAQGVIDPGSVDLIFSQAVLEHVDDLKSAYEAMREWLNPSGTMTHQIDFKCHGKANEWNGHWTYSDGMWRLIVGRRSYLLNRQPHSKHVDLIGQAGFSILKDLVIRSESRLRRKQLASRFRQLSDDDLTSSGAFIVAVRKSDA